MTDTREINRKTMEALESYITELYDQAYETVTKHWDMVRDYERRHPGWENSSSLQLRCDRRGNSIRIDWCGIRWYGSKKMGNRRMTRIAIPKQTEASSYSMAKLLAHAKEWEKPLVKETEEKLAAIRREASHVIKAMRYIREADKCRSSDTESKA